MTVVVDCGKGEPRAPLRCAVTLGLYSTLCTAIDDHLSLLRPGNPDLDPELKHLQRSLATASQRPDFREPQAPRYRHILDRAIEVGRRQGIGSIASAMLELPLDLPWDYHYPHRVGEADLAANIGFAELIGPDGPLLAQECRVGFTLIAPATEYPLHAHPAIELYLVIAGIAIWTASSGEQVVPPGGLVLHRTNEPHAMHTQQEPLLALYSWRGDLDTPAYYL